MPDTKPQHARVNEVRHDHHRRYETKVVDDGHQILVRWEESEGEHRQKEQRVDKWSNLDRKHDAHLRVHDAT